MATVTVRARWCEFEIRTNIDSRFHFQGHAMSESLVLVGLLVVAGSGFPGLLFGRRSLSGQRLATVLAVLGAGLGLAGVGWFWATGESQPIVKPWALPGGLPNVAIDGLSA